jgi:hypothetical protein
MMLKGEPIEDRNGPTPVRAAKRSFYRIWASPQTGSPQGFLTRNRRPIRSPLGEATHGTPRHVSCRILRLTRCLMHSIALIPLALCFCAPPAVAQSNPQSPSTPPASPNANAASTEKRQDCTISGMVVAIAASVPLKNALVTLRSVDVPADPIGDDRRPRSTRRRRKLRATVAPAYLPTFLRINPVKSHRCAMKKINGPESHPYAKKGGGGPSKSPDHWLFARWNSIAFMTPGKRRPTSTESA